tara:strand:- start:75 stop:1160 length:1086 start_codon:yes stop_codon:yes gene_type:complete
MKTKNKRKAQGVKKGNLYFRPVPNANSYGNTVAEVTAWGGKYGAAIMVPFNQTSLAQRKHQSRQKDVDRAHIARLAADIQTSGLRVMPYVEWDPTAQRWDFLTGHGRSKGVQHPSWNAPGVGGPWTEIPCRVVDFGNNWLGRARFIQKQNAHPVCMNHNMDDAVLHLHNLKEHRYFNGMTAEQTRKAAYAELNEFYPWFHTSKKKAIVDRAFKWDEVKHKSWQKSERYDQMRSIFRLGSKEVLRGSFMRDNILYIGSLWTSVEKALMVGAINRATALEETPTLPLMDIKIVSDFDVKAGTDIDKLRSRALEHARLMNIHILTSLGVIGEVSFLPQKLHKAALETTPVTYVWSPTAKKFIKR